MEIVNALAVKIICPHCARVNRVFNVNITATQGFERTDWKCENCKLAFDTKIWLENNFIYQEALGSASINDYQKYSSNKIKIR